jgi:hypothetical protein
MREILYGILVAECLVVALFFLRFWRQSKDRLFLFFAAAFAILAPNWLLLVYVSPENEARALVYLFRLVAFALIIIAIVDKNRSKD